MWRISVFAAGLLLAGVHAQDEKPCDSYDVNTGQGSCGGSDVAVGYVLCSEGFDKTKCVASKPPDGNGRVESYYFKGTPTGLPQGSMIQGDCTDLPTPPDGVAMVQAYVQSDGTPDGCFAAGSVADSNMTYTENNGQLATVTVNFAAAVQGGATRFAFIRVTCTAGKTSGFTYTTVGDEGHSNVYEIDVQADCAAAGPTGGGSSKKGSGSKSETGWILVGLVLGVSVVYFGGGYVFLWKVRGAEGRERIPQVDFWSSLPGLIKDGFGFVKSKITGQSYTPL